MDDSARSRTVWRNKAFMLFWSGQSISQFGSAVTVIVLPLFAVLGLHASTFDVGLLTSAGTLAFLLVGLPAGAMVERRSKRQVMRWCDGLRATILAAIGVAVFVGAAQFWQLVLAAFLNGVLTVFFEVAYQSYLPLVVEQDQLVDGNGKLGTTESLASTAGPGLAGVLIGAVGAAWSVVIDAASFVLSWLTLTLIRVPEPRYEDSRSSPLSSRTPGMYADIIAGLSYTWRHRALRRIAACGVSANLFASMYNALEIPYLSKVLHTSASVIGVVVGLGGIGGVLGGLAAGSVTRRFGMNRVIVYPLVVVGWLGLLIPLARPGWAVLLVSLGLAGNMAASVLFSTGAVSYRQVVCPKAMLSRVTASLRWASWGVLPLGALVGGALGGVLGERLAVLIAVLGCWLSGCLVLFSPLRQGSDPTAPEGMPGTSPHVVSGTVG